MAARGHNPVRAVRWGAVVLLAAAGTLAALVVSEWPRTGEMIAAQAKPVSKGRAAVPAEWALMPKMNFMPEEPDAFGTGAAWPGLVTAGSVEEARRAAQELANYMPPESKRSQDEFGGVGCGIYGPQHGWAEFSEYTEWWKGTPTGKLVEAVTAYDPARSGTTLRISPKVDLTAGVTKYNVGDGPSVGRIEYAGEGGGSLGESQVYDLSLRLDALGDSSMRNGLSAGVIGGLRAGSLLDRSQRDPLQTDPIPVVGGDARIKWSERSMLRASALGEAPGTLRDYVDLRLEQVWRIGGDSSLSLGWRHLRGIMSNELPEPTLKQDSILLELKIGF